MRIQLPAGLRTVLGSSIASLPSGTAFALLTKPAPNADRVLIWRPGQTEQTALGPDGSTGLRTSGSCLVVVPGGQTDETRTFEDGYSLLLSAKSWASVSGALVAERPLQLAMAAGSTLELVWPE